MDAHNPVHPVPASPIVYAALFLYEPARNGIAVILTPVYRDIHSCGERRYIDGRRWLHIIAGHTGSAH